MSAGVYSQIYIQLVFSPKIHSPIKSIIFQESLYKFISGIVNQLGHKSLAVNGMHDHIHVLFGMKPSLSISDTVKEIKRVSSRFIKEEGRILKFEWQTGYGTFSYSKSDIDKVIKYIINQKEHHKKETFKEEYVRFLEEFKIEYQSEYLFDFHE